MRREKIDLSPERQIITNMIVSEPFLRSISPIFKPQLLKTGYAKEVATWIVEYYNQFKENPGKNIQSIYRHKKKDLRDEEEADNISEFLKRLSEDWEQTEVHNVQYAVQQAIHYLKIRSFEILNEQIEGALSEGNPLRAEQLLAKYSRVEPPLGEGVSILRDAGAITTAFMSDEEVLFTFPGAMGKVIGQLHRGDFMSYMAPMKRGKTFHLWYAAETGMSYGHKVVFVTMEMSKNAMLRRAWQSLVGQPVDSDEVTIPYFEECEGKFIIRHRQEARKRLDPSNVEPLQKILRKRFRKGDVRLLSFPSKSATVEDIEAHIDNLAYYDNFVPDIIIIDYADIIRPSIHADYRHQLDDIWAGLRRMAQTRDALVITATQAEKGTFSADAKSTSVAEDIRKLAHVTLMVALNQKKEEAEKGIMRVAQIAIREGKQQFQQAVILSCLDIGRMVLDSRLENEVILDEDDPDEEEKPRKSKGGKGKR